MLFYLTFTLGALVLQHPGVYTAIEQLSRWNSYRLYWNLNWTNQTRVERLFTSCSLRNVELYSAEPVGNIQRHSFFLVKSKPKYYKVEDRRAFSDPLIKQRHFCSGVVYIFYLYFNFHNIHNWSLYYWYLWGGLQKEAQLGFCFFSRELVAYFFLRILGLRNQQ